MPRSRSTRPIVLLATATLLLTTGRASAEVILVDFSEYGVGPLANGYFAGRGILIPPNGSSGFVGFVQGDEALVSHAQGPFIAYIAAQFEPKVTRISVQVALSYQFVGYLRLSALDNRGGINNDVFTETVLQLNQVQSDPGFMGLGYFTLDTGPLSRPASAFVLTAEFMRSPFTTEGAEFGLSTISYQPVPAPPAAGLLAVGVVCAAGYRRLTRPRARA